MPSPVRGIPQHAPEHSRCVDLVARQGGQNSHPLPTGIYGERTRSHRETVPVRNPPYNMGITLASASRSRLPERPRPERLSSRALRARAEGRDAGAASAGVHGDGTGRRARCSA
ncbi:hypothetical protein GCM10011578_098070 [Streptomyces fuscichromogenes]|uniref:Uncharacterized protein n=1 Tax=Streptomyces fuscichromogenes TaxID=1324013 RepID=A0A918CXI7_9ACTN|nr:hypothetical protein GCM10011578_098070 [Streptomyces fuscichromogenes]